MSKIFEDNSLTIGHTPVSYTHLDVYKRQGLNGAVALWWNATSHITTGIQYRYADDKLGEDFYQDAIIYSIKDVYKRQPIA